MVKSAQYKEYYIESAQYKECYIESAQYKEYYIIKYESNQKDATMQVNLLFLVSSTCFGRCFRPLSGALDFIHSIW